ncbi:MAG: GNAT family N-acetyltransferase [Dehalococcoidia bacterium]|nr:GNAT family N-acetyltransferase [Dehalococcoidia bacterium]
MFELIKDDLKWEISRDFPAVEGYWNQLLGNGAAHHVFQRPEWVRAWWLELGQGDLEILLIKRGGKAVGIAPLLRQEALINLTGDEDVCDYLDIIALPGEERAVVSAMLDYRELKGGVFNLAPLHPTSPLLSSLPALARERNRPAFTRALDVSYWLDLPESWDEYLRLLPSRDRHELQRKFRRLEKAGNIRFYASRSIPDDFDSFLYLFRNSRRDKTAFLTPQREAFFRRLAVSAENQSWLRLYFLELNDKRVATTFCFDYNGVVYLYNSGYDPGYSALSAGLLCKALSIKQAVEEGRKGFDFLKGDEDYKTNLGGRPVPLYRLIMDESYSENPLTMENSL